MTKNSTAQSLESRAEMLSLANRAIILVNTRLDLTKSLYSNPHEDLKEHTKEVLQHDSWVRDGCVNYFKTFLGLKKEEDLEFNENEEKLGMKFSIENFAQYLDVSFRSPLPKEKEEIDIEIRKVCSLFLKLQNSQEKSSKKPSREF